MRLAGEAGYRIACSPVPGVNRPATPSLAVRRAALRGWHDRRDFELRLTDKYSLFRKLAALTGS